MRAGHNGFSLCQVELPKDIIKSHHEAPLRIETDGSERSQIEDDIGLIDITIAFDGADEFVPRGESVDKTVMAGS